MIIKQTEDGKMYLATAKPKDTIRDWWFVKNNIKGNTLKGYVALNPVSFPKHFIGRKVRFVMEFIDTTHKKQADNYPKQTKRKRKPFKKTHHRIPMFPRDKKIRVSDDYKTAMFPNIHYKQYRRLP